MTESEGSSSQTSLASRRRERRNPARCLSDPRREDGARPRRWPVRETRQVLECASPLVFWRFDDGGEPRESARGLAQFKTYRAIQGLGSHAFQSELGAFHG